MIHLIIKHFNYRTLNNIEINKTPLEPPVSGDSPEKPPQPADGVSTPVRSDLPFDPNEIYNTGKSNSNSWVSNLPAMRDEPVKKMLKPGSLYIVFVIGLMYGIKSVFDVIRLIGETTTSRLSSSFGLSGVFGNYSSNEYLFVLGAVVVAMAIMVVIASYKSYQGRLSGLYFLTGGMVLYGLPQLLGTYLSIRIGFFEFDIRETSTIQPLSIILMGLALIWTFKRHKGYLV